MCVYYVEQWNADDVMSLLYSKYVSCPKKRLVHRRYYVLLKRQVKSTHLVLFAIYPKTLQNITESLMYKFKEV